jgi:hypothetical protein
MAELEAAIADAKRLGVRAQSLIDDAMGAGAGRGKLRVG